MNINELVSALEGQEQNLKDFLDCIVQKQKAIVQNDIDALHYSLADEEKILAELDGGTEKISSSIQFLAEENGLDVKKNSVTEFLTSVKNNPEINVNTVTHLQNSIKDLILKSAFINEQNKILIDHSRSFIKETISMLIGLSKGPLLDRKI